MLDIIEITIEEFRKDIYDKYVELFPEEEQRQWRKIKDTYNEGIEHFYKIVVDKKVIGFFLLERLGDLPYYLDYFAIYSEYQSRGYGTKALKYLFDNIVKEDGLIGEIETVDKRNPQTVKRLEFYKRLGFVERESLYLLFDVYYTPLIRLNNNNISKDDLDKMFFEYYLINVGKIRLKKNCKIIK